MKQTCLLICMMLFIGICSSQIYAYEKIGFFDITEVMLKADSGRKDRENFRKVYDELKAKIQDVEKDLKTRKDDLEKKRPYIKAESLKELEDDYLQRFKSYQMLVRDSNEELQSLDNELVNKSKPLIMKVVEKIRKEEKYSSIIEKKDAGISYSKDKDITDKVLEEYNRFSLTYTATTKDVSEDTSIISSVDKLPPADSTAPVILITSPKVRRGVTLTAKDASITVIGKAKDASGIATVTINGEMAALNEDGDFSADVLLKVGENKIVVTATNIHKNSATETFILVRGSGQIAKTKSERIKPATSYESGKYYALIIGNDDYQHLSRLETAVNDATAVEKILKELYGFESKLLLNATRKDILSAINDFRKKLIEQDNLLIYYAGHGEFDRSADKAYWLPIDAQRDDPSEWIIADDITSSIKRLSSRHVLIVSDSCYSGTLTRSAQTSLINKGDRDEFLKKMTSRPSRTLMASGGNEPVADGGGSGHSIFTDSFLKALREIDNSTFTADELFY